jgi:hypothetical protein
MRRNLPGSDPRDVARGAGDGQANRRIDASRRGAHVRGGDFERRRNAIETPRVPNQRAVAAGPDPIHDGPHAPLECAIVAQRRRDADG